MGSRNTARDGSEKIECSAPRRETGKCTGAHQYEQRSGARLVKLKAPGSALHGKGAVRSRADAADDAALADISHLHVQHHDWREPGSDAQLPYVDRWRGVYCIQYA